jgi:hypothetical protein
MVRPRRITATPDPPRPIPATQAPPRLPAPIPASYYARPTDVPPEPAGPRPARRSPVTGRRRRRLGLVGGVVVCAALLALLAHGLASNPWRARPDALAPPGQGVGPAATGPPAGTPVPDRTASTTPRPSPNATPRGAPAPASVTFVNAPLTVHHGDSPTLEVRTTPGTTCTVDLGYPSAPQLAPATSSAGGSVSWTWRVTGRPVTGTYTLAVSCGGATGTTRIVLS